MRISTLAAVLAAFVCAGPPAAAQSIVGQPITTSTIQTRVFNNGSIQGDCSTPPLFTFNGIEGGCGESFILGLSSSLVLGRAYNSTTFPSRWTPGSIGPSTVFPYPTLTSGIKTVFSRPANNVSVEANHYYSEANPDFIVHQFKVTNTGTSPLVDVYPGIYHDFDIGGSSFNQNLGGYDAATQTLYVYFNAANPYYGITALAGTPVSGYNFNVPFGTPTGSEEPAAALWSGLTTPAGPISPAQDQRGVIGSGPYTIAAGATLTVAFATLGGTNEADLLANAAQVRAVAVAAGDSPTASTDVLSLPTPNPATEWTQLSLTVEQNQAVRVTVLDALGREVAQLFEGPVPAGTPQTMRASVRSLPAGLYTIRAEGETFVQTQRLVVTR